ncbi:MAG: hypothetical protein ACERKV_12020 [Clostridiaceae bacterium]
MEFNWVEWLGYAASVIVAISLLMSSIVKLRWYNLIGALTFSIYGFLIGALPVGVLNMFIVFINIYYLVKMKSEKEYFKLVKATNGSEYFNYFLDFYKEEITKYLPDFKLELFLKDKKNIAFYILRDAVPAGIFTGYKYDDETFIITLDFVTPAYRDFKSAKFIYEENKDYFIKEGYKRLCAPLPLDEQHIKYLNKVGFSKDKLGEKTYYIKNIRE